MCYTYDKSKVGIPESFKVGWYPHKKTESSHLKEKFCIMISAQPKYDLAEISIIYFETSR